MRHTTDNQSSQWALYTAVFLMAHTVYMYHDMYMHARITYTVLVETLNRAQSINVHAQQCNQWCLAAAHTFSASSHCRTAGKELTTAYNATVSLLFYFILHNKQA